ncbi:MAG TPA: hypothetical protein VFD04_16585 [Actinomycetes bacterium]|nr:hypothetical protein [Actinomycetes bacterium]
MGAPGPGRPPVRGEGPRRPGVPPGRLPWPAAVRRPDELLPRAPRRKGFRSGDPAIVKRWVERHRQDAERLQWEGKFAKQDLERLLQAMQLVEGRRPVEVQAGATATLRNLGIAPGAIHTIFLRIDPPPKAKAGDAWEFSVVQRDAATGAVQGGADYAVRVNRAERSSSSRNRLRASPPP